MVEKTSLKVQPAQWSETAGAMLRRAMLCDPGATVETLRALVEGGGGALFEVGRADRIVGYVVLRIDRKELFPEGVIVAAAGRLPGADLIASVLPEIERRFVGVSRIRVHTARPGLVKKLARQGYGFQEFVLGKTIPRRQPAQQQQGGGGGSSSSAETTSQNIDKRLVVDQGIGISSDSSTVNVEALDGGAIGGAMQYADLANARAVALSGAALSSAQQSFVNAIGLSQSSLDASRASFIAASEASAGAYKGAIDLSKLSIDRVLDIAGDVFTGAFSTIDKNAQLIDRAGGFVDKAYADAKGSGAERFYIACGVVAVVAVVAIKGGAFK